MSLTHDGKRVVCDGEGCTEEASLPVALHLLLSKEAAEPQHSMNEWLSVLKDSESRHYCPRCTKRYIAELLATGSIHLSTLSLLMVSQ